MKISVKILALAVMAACLSSCFKDDRNNFLPEESVYLLNEKVLNPVDVALDSVEVVIIKSGKGMSECDVTIGIDQDVLAGYNEANETLFDMLPENVLTLSESSVHFAKEECRKTVWVKWDSRAVSALLTIKSYVIPISIQADPLELKEGRSSIIIQPFKK